MHARTYVRTDGRTDNSTQCTMFNITHLIRISRKVRLASQHRKHQACHHSMRQCCPPRSTNSLLRCWCETKSKCSGGDADSKSVHVPNKKSADMLCTQCTVIYGAIQQCGRAFAVDIPALQSSPQIRLVFDIHSLVPFHLPRLLSHRVGGLLPDIVVSALSFRPHELELEFA